MLLIQLASNSPQWEQEISSNNRAFDHYGYTITLVDSTLVLIGGYSSYPRTSIGDVELLNLRQKPWAWRRLDSCDTPGPRLSSHTSVALNGLVVIFGGISYYAGRTEYKNETWTFDPSSCRWELLECSGDVPCPRGGHASTNHGSDFLYVFGGIDATMKPLCDLYVFKLSSKDSNVAIADASLVRRWFHIMVGGDIPLRGPWHSLSAYNGRLLLLGIIYDKINVQGRFSPSNNCELRSYMLDTQVFMDDIGASKQADSTELLIPHVSHLAPEASTQAPLASQQTLSSGRLLENPHSSSRDANVSLNQATMPGPQVSSFSVNEALSVVGSHTGIVYRRLIDRGGFGEVHEVETLSLVLQLLISNADGRSILPSKKAYIFCANEV